MTIFTIEDYIKYTRMFPEVKGVMEESEVYELETTHQYHDKIFKDILDNKKEFINFMEQYVNFPKGSILKEENIEKYNRKFITFNFKTKESDIIYKIKDKNIFILIEHQSTIDYQMPERIVEYCLELIRSARAKNYTSYPLICPIVLYTGNKKWDAPLTISENQESGYGFKKLNYPKYNLIDINNYTKEELIDQKSGISKIILFEKIKTKEEIEETIKKLIKKKMTEDERKAIKRIFEYSNLVKKLLNQEELEKCKEILEGGGKGTMENFEKFIVELLENKIREVRRIRKAEEKALVEGTQKGIKKGIAQGITQGITQGIVQVAKNMLKKNMEIEQIKELTGLTRRRNRKIGKK